MKYAPTESPLPRPTPLGPDASPHQFPVATTACERDCHDCAFRAGRHMRRATFKPEEMARAFVELHRQGLVQGLFLSTGRDPKMAFAQDALAGRPVEINRAPPEMLRRVPGIGPVSAERILEARRSGRLREISKLRALGVSTNRAAPFILLDGRRPTYQTGLFPATGTDSALV